MFFSRLSEVVVGKIFGVCMQGGINLKGISLCSEALLKHGADLWNNIDRFKKFANASLQLCKVYMEIASSTGSWRELNLAEMHLRSVIRQAVNFSDTDELRDLQACLEEVKKRIEAASVSSNSNHSCLKINLNRLGSSV